MGARSARACLCPGRPLFCQIPSRKARGQMNERSGRRKDRPMKRSTRAPHSRWLAAAVLALRSSLLATRLRPALPRQATHHPATPLPMSRSSAAGGRSPPSPERMSTWTARKAKSGCSFPTPDTPSARSPTGSCASAPVAPGGRGDANVRSAGHGPGGEPAAGDQMLHDETRELPTGLVRKWFDTVTGRP